MREKERKREREEQRGKERTVGAKSVWREFKSQNVFWNRGKIKEGKEINGKKTAVLLLSKCTGVLILKGVPKVLYLSFALDKMLMRRVNPKKKRMICLLQNSYLKKKKKKKKKINNIFYDYLFSMIIIVGKLRVFNYYFRMCKAIFR